MPRHPYGAERKERIASAIIVDAYGPDGLMAPPGGVPPGSLHTESQTLTLER